MGYATVTGEHSTGGVTISELLVMVGATVAYSPAILEPMV